MSKKVVRFNDKIEIIFEPPGLSLSLKEARIPSDDYISRQLDKIRMENLLNPILTLEHRKKIQNRNSNNVV